MGDPVVTVKQGVLRGVETVSVTGGSYLSFKGIPYAAPPVGDLRFRVSFDCPKIKSLIRIRFPQ